MKKPVVLGIDLGGTNVRAGAFDPGANLLALYQAPIQAHEGPEAGIRRIFDLLELTLNDCRDKDLVGIGIGSTGPVDRRAGAIQNPYTLPGWENVPIVKILSDHFHTPVTLENDADSAALGEYWAGAGKDARSLYVITVGTGIGTALILDGNILRGVGGAHPEGGHHIIDPAGPPCYCGASGCWEALASGPAIGRKAQARLTAYPDSLLWKMAGEEAGRIDARMVAEAAYQDDPLARTVIEETAGYIAQGLINVIFFFSPEVIILTGGVMHSYDLFSPTIEKMIAACSVIVPAKQVHVRMARLGQDAGLYGAAYAILRELKGEG